MSSARIPFDSQYKKKPQLVYPLLGEVLNCQISNIPNSPKRKRSLIILNTFMDEQILMIY